MQIKQDKVSETEVTIIVIPSTQELQKVKELVLSNMGKRVKLAGFREGKAPLNLVEKNVDAGQLQQTFLEEVVNHTYPKAIVTEKLRPIGNPEISVKKFVPYETLEFEAKVTIIGPIKLPNYKSIKKPVPKLQISSEEVNEVLSSLRQRTAEKKDVNRMAKNNDQVWIDFKGVNSKGEPIKGADGENYPVVIGSNTFIPGFEDNLIGMKAGDTKEFKLKFPKDYGFKALAGKDVKFTATMQKVQEIILPKLDNAFAAKSGPFSTLQELKKDIKRQLQVEKDRELIRNYETELIKDIAEKSQVTIPKILISQQSESMLAEFKQNLSYRGQNFEDFLLAEGISQEEFEKSQIRNQAEERVKVGLVLTEISEKEGLTVANDEVEARISQLKQQYTDPKMRAELDKPENKSEIASRILTEKTLDRLVSYATKK
ncbi:trigger factor [Candidatus Saccharibacteria bacterium]|nr:trigger factor [Candidatus Saccharibacteria bacterium]